MENCPASAPRSLPGGTGRVPHLSKWEILAGSRFGFPSSYSIFSSKACEGCHESTF